MRHEVVSESDRNVVRVTFFLKNNIDEIETVNPTDELELDVKTLQKRLGEKLGIIEEECQKVQCKLGVKLGIKLGIKLGESLYKVGRKSPFFTFLIVFFSQDNGTNYSENSDHWKKCVDIVVQ